MLLVYGMLKFICILLTRYIDMAESLCQKRALEAFQLDPSKWGGTSFAMVKHITLLMATYNDMSCSFL